MSRLDDIDGLTLDDLTKGVPGGVVPFRLDAIGSMGWNVLAEDLPLPVAVLKAAALSHNGRWMAGFLDAFGAVMAPHGKTTMSPQLFQRQLDDGAWAITVATVHQIQVCRRFGFDRIVLANQLIGRQAIRYVLDALEADADFDFYCLVDSEEGVEMLARAVAGHSLARPLNVMLEGGIEGGRTGCRDLETAMGVARAVKAAAPHLALRGAEGFEGLLLAESQEEQETRVGAFVDFIAEIATACAREDLFAEGPVILSAGGSAYYDMVVERFARAALGRETLVLTRSGCYLSHDSGLYTRAFARLSERSPSVADIGEGPRPALELWTYVQSRPEPGKVICTMGKRDVSYDAGLPVAELWYRPGGEGPEPVVAGCVVTELNDQHTHMTVPPESPFRVGDMISFGISHPCTTFDKWQVMYVVDDAYDVISAIRTFF